jgi:hypothetical protein
MAKGSWVNFQNGSKNQPDETKQKRPRGNQPQLPEKSGFAISRIALYDTQQSASRQDCCKQDRIQLSHLEKAPLPQTARSTDAIQSSKKSLIEARLSCGLRSKVCLHVGAKKNVRS